MGSLTNKTVSGVKWNAMATVFKIVVQVAQPAILTRMLEKSDFGIIAIATVVIGFTELFSDIGLTAALIHKQEINRKQYSSIFWANIMLSVAIFGIIWLITPLVANYYHQPILNRILPLLGLQIIISAFGRMFMTMKAKELDFKFISITSVIGAVLGFLLSVILAWQNFGVYSLVFGQLFMYLVMQSAFTVAGMRRQRIMFYFNYREIKDFIKIGGYQLGSQILDYLTVKFDVFLIGRLFGMENLAVYSLAKEFITRPAIGFTTLVSSVASAAFAKIQNDLSLIKEKYGEIMKLLMFIAFPIYMGFFLFADPIVELLYDKEFSEVAIFIRILTLTGIVNAIGSPVGIITIALGKTNLGFRWTIVRILISVTAVVISSLFGFRAVGYSLIVVAILSFFLYWAMVLYPASGITLKELTKMFDKEFYISLITSVPFLSLLFIPNVSLVTYIFTAIIFAILYLSLQYRYNRTFITKTLKLIFNR